MAPSHNQVSINGHFQGEKMGQIMFFFSNRNCDHFDIDWINILHRQIWTSSVHLFPCWSDGNFLTSQFQTVTKRKPSPRFGKKPNSQLEAEMCRNKTSIDIINTWKHAATITGHWRGHWCHYEHLFKQSHHQQLHQGQATALTQYTAQHIQSLHRLVPQVNCICRILWDPIRADNMWNSENNNREQNVLCPIISPQIQGGSLRSQFVSDPVQKQSNRFSSIFRSSVWASDYKPELLFFLSFGFTSSTFALLLMSEWSEPPSITS